VTGENIINSEGDGKLLNDTAKKVVLQMREKSRGDPAKETTA
jgi:hypothetical protein